MIVTSKEFALKLCAILGEDPNTVSRMVLDASVGCPVSIEISRYLSDSELEEVVDLFKLSEIVKQDDEQRDKHYSQVYPMTHGNRLK